MSIFWINNLLWTATNGCSIYSFVTYDTDGPSGCDYLQISQGFGISGSLMFIGLILYIHFKKILFEMVDESDNHKCMFWIAFIIVVLSISSIVVAVVLFITAFRDHHCPFNIYAKLVVTYTILSMFFLLVSIVVTWCAYQKQRRGKTYCCF